MGTYVDPFDIPRDIRILTLTGPSASGKTSLVRELIRRHPDRFKLVVSLTSRSARENDLPGEYRCNTTEDEFMELKRESALLWMTPRIQGGNRYATLKRSVDEAVTGPEIGIMILVPDTVHLLRAHVGAERVLSVFVRAADEAVLRERLERRMRRTQPEQELSEAARREIETRILECGDWERRARLSPVPYVFFDNSPPIPQAAEAFIDLLHRYDIAL